MMRRCADSRRRQTLERSNMSLAEKQALALRDLAAVVAACSSS
jgi:hypothetical protein